MIPISLPLMHSSASLISGIFCTVRLAPFLYLQLDNCVRENKNNFIICFLALLVDLDIFEKVR